MYESRFIITEVERWYQPYQLELWFCCLVLGLVFNWYVFRRRSGRGLWDNIRYVIPVNTFLLLTLLFYLLGFDDFSKLARAYESGDYDIVSGQVVVLREQAKEGHSPGDLILVDGEEIDINYYTRTSAYRKTLANDGILKEGVNVRLYLNTGKILRIDVAKQPSESGEKE